MVIFYLLMTWTWACVYFYVLFLFFDELSKERASAKSILGYGVTLLVLNVLSYYLIPLFS